MRRRTMFLMLFLFLVTLCGAEKAQAQTIQYFPQLADGGGYVTTWYFTGLGAGPSVVTVELFQQNGNPLIVQTDRGTASTFTLNVSATGEISLRTLGAPVAVQVGWVRVTSSQPIGATEVFQYLVNGQVVSQAGVLSSDPAAVATLFVSINGRGRSTGIALANISPASNPVTFTIYTQGGSILTSSTMTLGPQAQVSRFITELPGFEQIGAIEGSLGISALARFSVVSLVLDGAELSTLPTLPGRIAGRTTNTVGVPAIGDIALAGMPTGYSFTGFNNVTTSVPLNSPAEAGIGLIAGKRIQVSAAGTVQLLAPYNSDGIRDDGRKFGYDLSQNGLPNNGIGDLRALFGGLIGVFLGPNQPDAPRPTTLDFSGGAADLVIVQPFLKQPFFIGSGKTSQGQTKQFVIPDGATRLFLSPFSCAGCASSLYKASGSFTVNLTLTQ